MEHIPRDSELAPQSFPCRPRFNGLWLHPDFRRLWTAQTVSQFGSLLTSEALPYIALLTLHVTPQQMGQLGAAGSAPLLILGLFIGVLVDRMRRRPIMIAADIGRALLLLSIPLAFLWGALRIEHLYVVAALMGIMSVFFDVAYQSFLPTIVDQDELLDGNSKLGMSASIAEISGPPIGGVLVQIVGGPATVLFDACSFAWSALMLRRIRTPEPVPAPATTHAPVGQEIVSGLRIIAHTPVLRSLAVASVIRSFFGWFYGAIYILYAIRVLGLSTALVGITIACGGIGALLGAVVVAPITRRFGVGPAIVGSMLTLTIGSFLIWLAGGVIWLALPLMIAAQLIADSARVIGEINQVSLVQTIAPAHTLGRVNASMHVMDRGIGTLGMLTGGFLAEWIGLRPTVAVIVGGTLLGGLWLLVSPVRRLRAVIAPPEQTS